MSMTMPELRQRLSAIEPDDSTYAGIGATDVPLLQQLLNDEEGWLAGRAVYALSRINAMEAHMALSTAADSPRSEVRVAVAANAGNLPPKVSDSLLQQLLEDQHVGVRKFAIKSVSAQNSASIHAKVSEIASRDDNPVIRATAQAQNYPER
jgi:HEAT repeat protein